MLLSGVATAAAASAAPAAARTDRTSAAEARRVDRVPAPDPQWFDCTSVFGATADCGTVALPLDYDKPRGATTEVALLRVRATDPARKIGTLFVNPGGPGGSGVLMAAAAEEFLTEDVRARFDVVGIDPRGTNFSTNVACFRNAGEQAAAYGGLSVPFPTSHAEEDAYVTSSEALGRACATTGTPLSASMSTAEVARDMDVVRRVVGDQRLTYLGFSYGSYLGAVYANMFPDRVRAVTVDGVLDPVAWAGTRATANVPQTQRLRSGEAAWASLQEILDRCEEAGPERCELAALGEPHALFDEIVADIKAEPVPVVDPETGEDYGTITYATLVSFLLSDMYAPDGWAWVAADLAYVRTLQHPEEVAEDARDAASAGLAARVQRAKEQQEQAAATTAKQREALGFAFPYDNSLEAFTGVLCTDGLNPARADRWRAAGAQADADAPGFGPLWTWASAPCASRTWTAQDEDAFRGPFTARTAAPVLVVGNYWDPATSYEGAVALADRMPRARLLSSDSWGHTAYGTSACVTGAVDRYLLTGKVPAEGTVCTGDLQPFPAGDDSSRRPSSATTSLPPVVPPLPGAAPRS